MKAFVITVLVFFLASCTFMPKVVNDKDNKRCELNTNKRILEVHVPDGGFNCGGGNGKAAAVCLSAAGIYTATTAIVSGSIVLIGNTVHWLEKQGRCEDGLINAAYKNFIAPLLESGGNVIEIETADEDG